MILKLYKNFSKKRNSTKQPTGTYTQVDVYMKDGCSVENPVFLIDGVDLDVNYCDWDGHYYFVEDIVVGRNNIYELHCSDDVLATYKSDIGSSTQFVERSASQNDPMLIDRLVSAQQDIVAVNGNTTTLSDNNWTMDAANGTYILQTFSKDGINVYGYTSMSQITGILNNDAYGVTQSQLTNLINTIGLNMLDVSAYVSNVMWIPFSLTSLAGSTQNVRVSFWELINFSAKNITTRTINIAGDINKPTNLYNDFRMADPRFSQYSLYLPGVGCVGISALDAATADLSYSLTFDLFTGACQYLIYSKISSDTRMIGTYCGQLGVQVPYSTTRIDTWAVADSLVNAGNMAGAGTAGIALGAAKTTLDVCENVLTPQHSFNSVVGNMSSIVLRPYIRLDVVNYGSKDALTAVAGQPLYEWKTINTLSGYVQCSNPSLDVAGFGAEKDTINSYLSNGFYYE